MAREALSRRTFLRGVGLSGAAITVGLPAFESQFNASGTALTTSVYSLPTTAGAKIKQRVLMNPAKGVLWTYVFTAEESNTRVTITEDGVVSNVIFRFLSRYAFGHTATIDTYLTALGKQFGESVEPQ